MNLISNVYVINMDHSTERMKRIIDQESKIGMKITRLPAIVGKDLTTAEINTVGTTFCKYFCTRTMIAIFLSHKKAWQTMIDNDDKYSIIMEDDYLQSGVETDETLGDVLKEIIMEELYITAMLLSF